MKDKYRLIASVVAMAILAVVIIALLIFGDDKPSPVKAFDNADKYCTYDWPGHVETYCVGFHMSDDSVNYNCYIDGRNQWVGHPDFTRIHCEESAIFK